MSNRISTVLIDLSGTLHIENLAITDAPAALKLLRKHVNVRFVTNTTKESRNVLHRRLESCGFEIEKSEIFTSLIAAKQLIERNSYRPFFIVDDAAMEEFEGIDSLNPNAVVIGLAPEKFTNEWMNKAFQLIKNENAALIAIHKGRYYQKKDGLHLGPGAYVAGLEYSTGVQATVVGKPEPMFFEAALNEIGSRKEETVMVGDDVNDDVIGAIQCGMRGILVKTGKYRNDDELKIVEEKRNLAANFAEAVKMIIENRVK